MAVFTSDNVSGIHPAILQALIDCNSGTMASYGADALTKKLKQRLSELFETAVNIALLSSGTAANGLSLSLYTPPYGAIFCHRNAQF